MTCDLNIGTKLTQLSSAEGARADLRVSGEGTFVEARPINYVEALNWTARRT
jgi:hypothetical protein